MLKTSATGRWKIYIVAVIAAALGVAALIVIAVQYGLLSSSDTKETNTKRNSTELVGEQIGAAMQVDPVEQYLMVEPNDEISKIDAESQPLAEEVTETLITKADTVQVAGLVTNESGVAVSGANVWLNSNERNSRYRSLTDESGKFSIRGIKLGSDYQLIVSANGPYERYTQHPVVIGLETPTVTVRLNSLPVARIAGNIMSVDGNPIPNFSLTLRGSRAGQKTVSVTSDDVGYFETDNAPPGDIIFSTMANPLFVISGLSVEAGDDTYPNLVLDSGDNSIRGQVLAQTGNPLSGAELSLFWQHKSENLTSTSTRQSITDESGIFQFTELGRGIHTLKVSATGYQRKKVNYDVGRQFDEVLIRLDVISQ